MALMKNEDTNTRISMFVSMEAEQEVIRTSQQLLTGAVYIQRIGNPTVSYSAAVYVDRSGKALLQAAEDTAALLKIEVKHGVYYGRITALKFSDRMAGDWFKAEVSLAKEASE